MKLELLKSPMAFIILLIFSTGIFYYLKPVPTPPVNNVIKIESVSKKIISNDGTVAYSLKIKNICEYPIRHLTVLIGHNTITYPNGNMTIEELPYWLEGSTQLPFRDLRPGEEITFTSIDNNGALGKLVPEVDNTSLAYKIRAYIVIRGQEVPFTSGGSRRI
ncbi:hypothetical protein [Desulforamulus aquiferis]|uniref:Intracellular proteinase inhibitor BsuPI domain-containing protein n=1 Tax=Desulforamulus aquiferis TaxID=1397668 RepID=A0AAW7ZHD1_9FIRM|nr:hypothetical protein [Desulforamulus aquiferis]MDO7788793.1 hypothetical protein [Desulforamulus aquiferis]